ncbi:MAG: type II CRISPR RNA-guided endonuclease Cas9, partial [Streptococcaceae bacterium]|nr:type II CRISPR RNA-guided endonuclease Cas9 [Streptococcaceae bacterium]
KEILATLSILSNKAFEEKVNEIYSYQLFFDIQKANDIDDPDNPVKFSHKVDKKANRTVANQTIYGTRKKNVLDKKSGKVNTKEEYTFGTIKNIYNVDDYAKFKKKLFDKKGDMMENVFLVQELDPKTWEKLLAIIKEYPETEEITQDNGKVKKVPVSPFELYRRNYGFITKYAKKDNGPKVVSLKYYDSRVGNHIDITPENAKNRVILQSLNPWRTDVYYNKEKEEYEILGLKYKDLKYSNGEYGITKEKYEELKRGLISQLDGTVIEKRVVSKDSEFCFSLYKNDRLLIKNPETSEEVELLFGSRNETSPGYVEMKPIHKSKFEPGEEVCLYGKTSTNGQFLKKLAPKGFELVKINTDILGNKHYTEKEKLKFKIKV